MLLGLLVLGFAPRVALAHCSCRHPKVPHCADATAKHTVTVAIDLAVVDGTVEVVTQSGPFHVPVADLDGKTVLFVVMPRGEVFQGFFENVVTLATGTMQGATASITTAAVFAPGEYEILLFIDAADNGPGTITKGPQRGDIAAFDNTVCDPTGVSIRVAVGCEDATITLTNKHFIIF
jgi:hypothetical protein